MTGFKDLLSVEIPKGCLFYPCCGKDTVEPLKLFIRDIELFHFADIKVFSLPKVSGALTRPDFVETMNEMADFQLDDSLLSGLIYLETWQGPENIKIMLHKYDGAEVLKEIGQIAVFFYRGDSIAGLGSGQWWLGEKLFNRVLDKLAPGGLVITDGSNPDPDFRSAPWRELYMHSQEGRFSDHNEIKPADFTYRNRQFTCLGSMGKRYGTVYVWKVDSC